MEKEGLVRITIASRHIFLVVIMVLAFALVACERPLNEEEPTPTLVPTVEGNPDLAPGETAPALVPTRDVVPPTPGTTPPDGGQPDGGEPAPEAPPDGGDPAQPADETQNPAPTDPNQAVTLPTGEKVHTVQAGDNLYRIGLQYGCTVAELSAYNGIANPHYINVGQEIIIPTTCGG